MQLVLQQAKWFTELVDNIEKSHKTQAGEPVHKARARYMKCAYIGCRLACMRESVHGLRE